MAGHSRIRRLSHKELIAELTSAYEDAAGWISQAEESGRAGALNALSPLREALDALEEARRRWKQARAKCGALAALVKRCDKLCSTSTQGKPMRHSLRQLQARLDDVSE